MIVRMTFAQCDHQDDEKRCPGARMLPAKDSRQTLTDAGWLSTPDKKTYCPQHTPTPTRRADEHRE